MYEILVFILHRRRWQRNVVGSTVFYGRGLQRINVQKVDFQKI